MAENQSDAAENYVKNLAFSSTRAVRKIQGRHIATPLNTIRVTAEGLDDFLSEKPSHFPPDPSRFLADMGVGGIDPLSVDTVPQAFIRPHLHRANENEEHSAPNYGLLTSNDDHVGRDLSNKEQPLHPIDQAGPNPYGDRKFYANEFQGMLTFDTKGVPAFHSRFPEAKSAQDIKEIRINIATKIPDYMQGETDQALKMEAMENDAFNGKPLKDVFGTVDPKMKEQVEIYAKQFEQAYGIKMTIGFDLPDPHLSLLGYNEGDPELLGFASFPPSVNEWPEMEGLGTHRGYMVMNNQYCATATGKEIYDLFVHEFGHTIGLAHPHDLALLNMSKRDALTATKMSYTDLRLRAFQHLVTDADGKPVLDKDGQKQYVSTGPDEGVLDLGFRKWVANPGVLGHVSQPDPKKRGYDGYKGVYDMAEHTAFSERENADSIVYLRERLLPMVPMINDGKHTLLKGSNGNDYIDTNPGYASSIKASNSRARQQFVLVEGHMEKVMGISGDNIIVAAGKGNQEILPGTGNSEIRLIYPDMQGKKTISSEGNDTLVLSEELLEQQPLHAKKSSEGVTLIGADSEVALGGKGIQTVRIVNKLGRTLVDVDVKGLDANALNELLFDKDAWRGLHEQQAKEASEKAAAEKAAAEKEKETAKPATPAKAAAAEKRGSWREREEARSAARGQGYERQ